MDQFKYRVGSKDILVYRSVYAPVKSNMYTILSGKEAAVFDPNFNEELLLLFKEKEIEKVYILLTHGHYDHISGVEWLKQETGAQIFCQSKCADRIANNKRTLGRLIAFVLSEEDKKDGGHRYQDFKASYRPFSLKADVMYDKMQQFNIGKLEFQVFSTPGHSEGSSCYMLYDKMVFTGDTLLQYDPVILKFPGGNKSDYEKISLPFLRSLSKETIIMPGHGDPFLLKDTNNI